MIGVLIMMIIMAVPITAIVSKTVLKYRQMELDKHPQDGLTEDELRLLVESIKTLKTENDDLKAKQHALEGRLRSLEQSGAAALPGVASDLSGRG